MTARGIRNNNPGNIRKNPKVTWQGQAKDQPDPDFVSYVDPPWGIRAIAKILLTYEAEGVDTIGKIIRRWAPPSENLTDAYVADVAERVGLQPGQVVDLHDPDRMIPVLQAIVTHENGCDPYALATYEKACELAGLSDKAKAA